VIAQLNLTFAQEPIRDAQWRAFRNRNRLDSSPENFAELMTAVATFLKPVVTAIHVDTPLIDLCINNAMVQDKKLERSDCRMQGPGPDTRLPLFNWEPLTTSCATKNLSDPDQVAAVSSRL